MKKKTTAKRTSASTKAMTKADSGQGEAKTRLKKIVNTSRESDGKISPVPAKRNLGKRLSVHRFADALAAYRPGKELKVNTPPAPDNFVELGRLLFKLKEWDGKASTVPDDLFCADLYARIMGAVWSRRTQRKPSFPEAVRWLDRNRKKMGVCAAFDDARKKLRSLRSRKPLIRVLMEQSRSGDSTAKELLAVLRLDLDAGVNLSRFRKILCPDSPHNSRPNLLAAAWRARWEYRIWCGKGDTHTLECLLDMANSPEKIVSLIRKRELTRERLRRHRLAKNSQPGKLAS